MEADLWTYFNNKLIIDYDNTKLYLNDETNKLIIPYISVSGKKRNETPSNYYKFYMGGRSWMLHRVIFISYHKFIPEVVDHIDGDYLNCHIGNLRGVTYRENSLNRKKPTNNTTGVIGVTKCKDKFRASIYNDCKKINLGTFDTLEDAKEARKNAEEHYGYHTNHGKR